MLTYQSAIVQNVSRVEIFNSKKTETGDYSRKLVVTDDHGAMFVLTMFGALEHRLTINTVDVELKGGGKTV